MFDIGFSEIVVIGVVALVVIGPERLPKTARMLGHLFGRLQRYVNEVKADINREMELDELRRLKRDVESAARDIQQSVASAQAEVKATVTSIETDLNRAVAGASPSPPSLAALPAVPAAPLAEPPGTPPARSEAPASAPAAPAPAPADAPRQSSLPGFDRQ